MHKGEAMRLKRIITEAGQRVTGYHIYTLNKGKRRPWSLEVTDPQTGTRYVIHDREQWIERQKAKEFAAQHGA